MILFPMIYTVWIIAGFLNLIDIILFHLFHSPLVSITLSYYFYRLCAQHDKKTLIPYALACSLEGLLVHTTYAGLVLLLVISTYGTFLIRDTVNLTMLFNMLLLIPASLWYGIGVGIKAPLSVIETIQYTGIFTCANIILTVIFWKIFEKGRLGNR